MYIEKRKLPSPKKCDLCSRFFKTEEIINIIWIDNVKSLGLGEYKFEICTPCIKKSKKSKTGLKKTLINFDKNTIK